MAVASNGLFHRIPHSPGIDKTNNKAVGNPVIVSLLRTIFSRISFYYALHQVLRTEGIIQA